MYPFSDPKSLGRKWFMPVSLGLVVSGTLLVMMLSPSSHPAKAQPPACIDPPPGVEAWWPFDEQEGTYTFDRVGANHGTLIPDWLTPPQFGPVVVQNGLSFDGVDDYVKVADSDDLDVDSGSFTIDAWVCPQPMTPNSKAAIVQKLECGGAGYSLGLYYDGTNYWLYFEMSDGTNLWGNPLMSVPVPAAGCSHVAITVDWISSNWIPTTWYVNGTRALGPAVYQGASMGSLDNSAGLWIGRGNGFGTDCGVGRYFKGAIDEVELFKRALTEAEVQAIYNAGSAGKCKPASICGVKWNDFDGDGTNVCEGVMGEGGFTINLTGMGTTASTTTSANGAYCFNDVAPGAYELSETPLSPWQQTSPAPPGAHSASVAGGELVTGVDFGNVCYGTVCGVKYEDLNGNRRRDPGEGGVAGWTMTLEQEDACGNPYTSQTVTDANGGYCFHDVLSEYYSYCVFEETRPGWSGGGGWCANFPVPCGGRGPDMNFGNRPCIDPPDGLVSWWSGDGHPRDQWNGNNGHPRNGAGYAPGYLSGYGGPMEAFSLNGVTQDVFVPDAVNLSSPYLTIDAWISPTVSDTYGRFIVAKTGNGTEYSLRHSNNRVIGQVNLDCGLPPYLEVTSSNLFMTSRWNFVAMTWDGWQLCVYLNGTQTCSAPLIIQTPTCPTDMPLFIGSLGGTSTPTTFFSGLIDEVELYNRALSAAEIEAILQARTAGKCKPALDLALGGDHAMKLMGDGRVWAWGCETKGILGNCAANPSVIRLPDYVKDATCSGELTDIIDISSGSAPTGDHSLALTKSGHVWAWGAGDKGQLGDGGSGTGYFSASPVRVETSSGVPLANIVAVSGGDAFSLALDDSGRVWAWGDNTDCKLGLGGSCGGTQNRPVQVPGLANVAAISAGARHALALLQDGTVSQWGFYGPDLTSRSPVPIPVAGLNNIVAIATGGGSCIGGGIVRNAFSLALRNDGTVWAWGRNYYGNLGDGTQIDRPNPVQVAGPMGPATAISAACMSSAAIDVAGRAWAWGENGSGQLGDPSAPARSSVPWPVVSTGMGTAIKLNNRGVRETLAINTLSEVWGWGANSCGVINGVNSLGPITPPAQSPP